MGDADPIPEVPEDQATGRVAEVYADLRETLGVPFVNMIWRHLATVPEALRAVWGLVKPLYLSSDLDIRAADLRSAAAVPGIEPLPEPVWDCAGICAAQRCEIARLIEDYNRANSMNFLGLATASVVLRGEASRGPARRTPSPAAARPPGSAPPLPPWESLPDAARALVHAMGGLGRLAPHESVVNFYRHLTCWPAFLPVAYANLLPHHRAGTLHTAQQTLILEGRGIASEELLPLISSERFEIPLDLRDRTIASIDELASLVIGRMTVMGTTLRALLPPAIEPAAAA